MARPSTSFSVKRANSTTFVIVEQDLYSERPYIYAKVHPIAPIIILSGTGVNEPAEEVKNADITSLRELLETYPIEDNEDQPINPHGERPYLIILTHCHYDHIGGISQFLEGGTTEILASAAGRDFVESDLGAHSLCNHMNIPVPYYKVTHWAQSSERLTWPLTKGLPGDNALTQQDSAPVELGITILHTPGHTPDELAWCDHAENTMYVGDSFYQLGGLAQPIIFPPQGDLLDWWYSLNKIIRFVLFPLFNTSTDVENDWVMVPTHPKISAAHQTVNEDANEFLFRLNTFMIEVMSERRPVLHASERYGELFVYFMSEVTKGDVQKAFSLWCPARLILDAKRYGRMHPETLVSLPRGNQEELSEEEAQMLAKSVAYLSHQQLVVRRQS